MVYPKTSLTFLRRHEFEVTTDCPITSQIDHMGSRLYLLQVTPKFNMLHVILALVTTCDP